MKMVINYGRMSSEIYVFHRIINNIRRNFILAISFLICEVTNRNHFSAEGRKSFI